VGSRTCMNEEVNINITAAAGNRSQLLQSLASQYTNCTLVIFYGINRILLYTLGL
jgi:hypothetical protein